MKINEVEFPEIKRDYNYLTVKIKKRKIKLTYRIREYVIVPNEDKVRNLKRNGIKLKSFGCKHLNGKVTTVYYKPYADKLINLEQKKRTINKIINLIKEEHEDKKAMEKTWYNKKLYKTSIADIMDKEAITLDLLSSYYLGGFEGDKVLSQDRLRKIQKKEYTNLISRNMKIDEKGKETEDSKDSHTWEVRKMDKSKYEKHYKSSSNNKWSKSITFKMNNLFSYDDHKDESFNYDWMTDNWEKLNLEYHFKIDRIINPEKEYKAKWCLVDTKNIFEYDGQILLIDHSVNEYKVGRDNFAEMDKIFVIEQGDLRLYFDQNMNRIENKKIKTY